jgi:hypothetical protein
MSDSHLSPRYDASGQPGNGAARLVDACIVVSECLGDIDVDDVVRLYAIAAGILAALEADALEATE